MPVANKDGWRRHGGLSCVVATAIAAVSVIIAAVYLRQRARAANVSAGTAAHSFDADDREAELIARYHGAIERALTDVND